MESQEVSAGGRLERRDDAGFRRRYGTTYALLDDGEVSYALKSEGEDLERHTGRHVRVSGFLVEGFPAEPGEPGYISVTSVQDA